MKKIYFIIFCFIIFFTQCKKSNSGVTPEDPTPIPTKNCILISEKMEGFLSNYTYIYNDKNQLQQIVLETYPKDKGPFVFKYEYNDQGQYVGKKSYTQITNELLEKFVFEYNTKGQLIKSIRESYADIVYGYSKNILNGTVYYEYNTKDQLSKIYSENTKDKWSWSQVFTYDEYDDLVKVEEKSYSENTGQSNTIRTYEYDHAQLALPFPPILEWFEEEYKFSKHFCNKAFFHVQSDGKFAYSKEFKIEKYTAEKYPEVVHVITSGSINENRNFTYAYQCK